MDYIAIDIGASSGRLIRLNSGNSKKFELNEIYRFKNEFENINGIDYWNIDHLMHEILKGLEKVKKNGVTKCYVGIDTWGVDYCLINKDGEAIDRPVSYRDSRTKNAIDLFQKKMSLETLYKRTGIQIQPFNTVFQLLVEEKKKLEEAKMLMLMPDYLGYLFTGKAVTEKTNASTMQLLNLKTRKWDKKILEVLDVKEEIFPKLVEPGTILGDLMIEKFEDYDLPDATFISIATHDTASAVVGTPGNGDNWAYISSGTWSLMGVEIAEGISTTDAYQSNFTNEWGVQGTIRFLKNIMGMWLIQEVARMQNYQYSYAELARMASQEVSFQQFINVNDSRFLNPKNMIEEIQKYCQETKQRIPMTAGEVARCIYDNLALCYAVELQNLEKISGRKIEKLHVVGGGSNNQLLNQMTADICGIPVISGPSEATAIGNLMVQMIATKGYGTLDSARKDIQKSIDIKEFLPDKTKILSGVILEYKNKLGL